MKPSHAYLCRDDRLPSLLSLLGAQPAQSILLLVDLHLDPKTIQERHETGAGSHVYDIRTKYQRCAYHQNDTRTHTNPMNALHSFLFLMHSAPTRYCEDSGDCTSCCEPRKIELYNA